MGATARFRLRFLDRGQSAADTREVLEANAATIDAALTALQGYVHQLSTGLPGGATQQLIGLDTDGTPYFDPAGAILNPAGIGLDTDATPYVIAWTLPEDLL